MFSQLTEQEFSEIFMKSVLQEAELMNPELEEELIDLDPECFEFFKINPDFTSLSEELDALNL